GTATVSITVTGVNDGPTLNAIAPVTINEDAAPQTVNLTGISAGGGESQTLTVTAVSSNPAVIPNPTITYTSPNPTGTPTFAPAPNANGPATTTLRVSHGITPSPQPFAVTVTPVNDAPTAVDDSATTAEDTAVVVTVLTNDTDIDGDTLSVTSVTAPAHGTAV